MTFINDRHIEIILAIVSEKARQHSLCTEDNLAFSAAGELLPVSNAGLIFYMLGYKPGFFRDRFIELTGYALPALPKQFDSMADPEDACLWSLLQ